MIRNLSIVEMAPQLASWNRVKSLCKVNKDSVTTCKLGLSPAWLICLWLLVRSHSSTGLSLVKIDS